MTQITASMVRELREKSGAGMMECKKALEATSGDLEAAFDELRKSGLKTAAKKAGRETMEGRVVARVSDDGRRGAMVALACETDFVAKTPDFEAYLEQLIAHAFEHEPADVETMLAQRWVGGGTVADSLKALIGKLGENIRIDQVRSYRDEEGRIGAYVHHDLKKGALVDVATEADAMTAVGPLKDLCMHVVVFNPEALDRDAVPAELVERERAIIVEGLAGKPEEVRDKIVAGRLEKFFADRALTEQPWIKDDKTSVAKALTAALGDGTRLRAFARFQLGA